MNFSSFEALLTEITPKMDFIKGVSYIFDSEGRRITGLDQIHDGGISTFIVKRKSNYFWWIYRNLYLFIVQKICSWKLWSLRRWISCGSRFWSNSKSKKWWINQVTNNHLNFPAKTRFVFLQFFFVKLQSWAKKWIV